MNKILFMCTTLLLRPWSQAWASCTEKIVFLATAQGRIQSLERGGAPC